MNRTSIRRYTLWANSSTLGNHTLYFTFKANIISAENFGLVILIVFLPVIIIIIMIYAKKHRSVKIPSFIVKNLLKEINIRNKQVEFTFDYRGWNNSIRKFLSKLILWIDQGLFFDIKIFPNDFDLELNGILYQNQKINQIIDFRIQKGDIIRLITPNRMNISSGIHKIAMGRKQSIHFNMNVGFRN